MADPTLTSFGGGATRSSKEHRFDLIPRAAMEAIARRLKHGAEIHGENNWKQGGKDFVRATINHLYEHLNDYVENGNESDENTDAIITNAAFLCYFEAQEDKALPPGFYDVQVTDVHVLPNGRLDIELTHKGIHMSETFTPVTFKAERLSKKFKRRTQAHTR